MCSCIYTEQTLGFYEWNKRKYFLFTVVFLHVYDCLRCSHFFFYILYSVQGLNRCELFFFFLFLLITSTFDSVSLYRLETKKMYETSMKGIN